MRQKISQLTSAQFPALRNGVCMVRFITDITTRFTVVCPVVVVIIVITRFQACRSGPNTAEGCGKKHGEIALFCPHVDSDTEICSKNCWSPRPRGAGVVALFELTGNWKM